MNSENRKEAPDARCVFHITITSEQAMALALVQSNYDYMNFEIEEWR
jgi:hypothetical protein